MKTKKDALMEMCKASLPSENSDQSKHTQIEWKTKKRHADGKQIIFANTEDGSGYIGEIKDKAKAERIVKAVNMHDELIACIKDLSERLNLDGYDQDNVRLKNAMQLLKQAEGK